MTMTFGKYEGYDISDIPYEYLIWVRTNVKFKNYYLRRSIEHRIYDIEAEWQACEDLCLYHGHYNEYEIHAGYLW